LQSSLSFLLLSRKKDINILFFKTMLNIIKRPIFTPKTTYLIEMLNQYAFEVDSKITKPEIRLALEEIFSVDILRKKLETDNMIISFREKMNLMVPETNDAIAWQHFTEQEAVLMQRKSIFIPQFEVPDFVETPLPPGNKRDRSYWEKITVNRMKREAKKRRMSAKGNKCKADWIGTMVDHFD